MGYIIIWSQQNTPIIGIIIKKKIIIFNVYSKKIYNIIIITQGLIIYIYILYI